MVDTYYDNVLADTQAFQLRELDRAVLRFDYRDNYTVELEDVKEAFRLYELHSPHHAHKVLIVFGKYTTMEVDARKYTEQKDMPTPAQAVVIQGLAQRMIARFYVLLRKNTHPLKFFNNPEDALTWLRTV